MEKELAQSDITVRGKVPKTTQNFTFLKKIVFSGGFGDFFLIMIFDPIMGIFKFSDPWWTTGSIDGQGNST